MTFMFSISDLFFYNRDLHGVKLYPSYLIFDFREVYWSTPEKRQSS